MKNYLNETGTRYLFLLLDSCHLKIANCCLTIFYKQSRFLCETGFFL